MQKEKVTCYYIGSNAVFHCGGEVHHKRITEKEKQWLSSVIPHLEPGDERYGDLVKELKGFFDPEQHYGERINTDGNFFLKNGTVYGRDKNGVPKVVPGLLAATIKEYLDNGLSGHLGSLANFWKNCLDNEDYRRIEGMFEFLERYAFSITPQGTVIGYKKVCLKGQEVNEAFRGYYMTFSKGKGTVKHVNGKPVPGTTVGAFKEYLQTLKMVASYDRKTPYVLGEWTEHKDYDPDSDHLCSKGLHVGDMDYVAHFYGDIVLAVEFSPADVISLGGSDASQGKIRTRRLRPVAIVGVDRVEEPIRRTADGYWEEEDGGSCPCSDRPCDCFPGDGDWDV